MANHEVLLLKPVDGLGAEGDQVKVKAGYARNFLLPQGMAMPLTQANRKRVEALKKARGFREAKELDGAQALARQIEKAGIAIAVKTGEGGKLFGAVTANDIHEKLAAAGARRCQCRAVVRRRLREPDRAGGVVTSTWRCDPSERTWP